MGGIPKNTSTKMSDEWNDYYTDDVDYTYLLSVLITLFKAPIEFCSDNNSCPHFKKMKVYFNLMTMAVRSKNTDIYHKAVESLMENDNNFIHSFFATFLNNVDEAVVMERVFDNKDKLTNQEFLELSKECKEVRRFKEYIKENPPHCCS
jgi:hypothetical protein